MVQSSRESVSGHACFRYREHGGSWQDKSDGKFRFGQTRNIDCNFRIIEIELVLTGSDSGISEIGVPDFEFSE